MVVRYDKGIGVQPVAREALDMGLVTVNVWDATGNKRQEVQMPDDAPINRLLVVLLDKLKFPVYAPDGQPLSYKLHHRSSGKQLLDEQSLKDIGVKEGDVLRLQPEITAG
jgi:uncharacterized ubiquitin-like protein YukD